MNTIHPIMAQALAPFVKAPFVQSVTTKRMRKSTQTFHYCLCGVDLECELDYERASGDGWNEPREPEAAYLCEAFVGGVDIIELLDDDQKETIETAFLEQDRSDF